MEPQNGPNNIDDIADQNFFDEGSASRRGTPARHKPRRLSFEKRRRPILLHHRRQVRLGILQRIAHRRATLACETLLMALVAIRWLVARVGRRHCFGSG